MHQLNSIFFKKLFLGGGFLCLKKTSGNFRIEMAENAPNHNHMCFTRLSGLCVLDLYVYYIKFNLLFNKNNQQSTAIPPSRGGARGGQAGPRPTPKNWKLLGYPYTYKIMRE
jgi:hypothetical protein